MTSFVSVHIGGAGTKIGLQFCQQLRQEHQLHHETPIGSLNFFQEASDGTYRNRALFLDPDPSVKELFRSEKMPMIKDSIISGSSSAHNNFGEGAWGEGQNPRGQAVERMRKIVETSDNKCHFIYTGSACGGSGSGIPPYLIGCFRDYFIDNGHHFFQLIPELKGNYNPLQIYNSILQNNIMLEEPDLMIMMDNQLIERRLLYEGILHPSYKEINREIGHFLLESTSPYRFSGQLNTSIRKLMTNLLPFPRFKYIAPIFSQKSSPNHIESASSYKNCLIHKDLIPRNKIYTLAMNVRGDPFISEFEIHSRIRSTHQQQSLTFHSFLDKSAHVSMLDQPNRSKKPSASCLVNSEDNIGWLIKATEEFKKLFQRKAFLHLYTGVGMDEMEFVEAESIVQELQNQYLPHLPEPVDDQQEY